MKKLFLDTNVVLDFLLVRLPYSEDAGFLFELRSRGEIEVHLSALTLANVAYLISRSKKNPSKILPVLLSWVEVVDLKKDFFRETLSSGFADFEDGLQYFSALQVIGLDAIITRNKKDFVRSRLPVYSPSEFIKKYYS